MKAIDTAIYIRTNNKFVIGNLYVIIVIKIHFNGYELLGSKITEDQNLLQSAKRLTAVGVCFIAHRIPRSNYQQTHKIVPGNMMRHFGGRSGLEAKYFAWTKPVKKIRQNISN